MIIVSCRSFAHTCGSESWPVLAQAGVLGQAGLVLGGGRVDQGKKT